VWFGARMDGSSPTTAMLDEMQSRRNVNERLYYLGDGDVLNDAANDRPDLGASDTTVFIHMWPTSGNVDGLPVSGLPEDGGVVRVDDELIAYQEVDTSTGELKGVQRAVLGTESKRHSFGARVTQVQNVPVALLAGGITANSYQIALNKLYDFPRTTGYVKIDDEIIGYTGTSGTSLIMPQASLGESLNPESGTPDVGPGIFRARFGTIATDHANNAFVFFLPTRFPDRYQDRSADPQVASIILRKRVDGAIWKRFSWDEKVASFTDVKVYVRFDGTPSWDSSNIYSVAEGIVVSGKADDFVANPKSFLFWIDKPHDLNRLNLQADVAEVRILFQYEAGAYDVLVTPPANSWKDTPWLKALRAEYVAPVTIHYSEEVR
jgi:hypothetical protein